MQANIIFVSRSRAPRLVSFTYSLCVHLPFTHITYSDVICALYAERRLWVVFVTYLAGYLLLCENTHTLANTHTALCLTKIIRPSRDEWNTRARFAYLGVIAPDRQSSRLRDYARLPTHGHLVSNSGIRLKIYLLLERK